MTTLAIMATYEKKRLKCYGTVAAGEHVAVTVTDGAQWIGEGMALRLRVLFGPDTVGVFPFAEGDAWTATGTQNADAYCELNLNTLQAEKYLKHGGTCLWILDDVENHTLYATGEFDVLPWPKRRGIDEPIDLDGYPQLIEDMEELKAAWAEYQTSIAQQLAAKQDILSDLAAIRNGAAAGTTAIQPSFLLDGGKIKSDLLPSYVDDVIEVANYASLPNPGEEGKIYVTLDTNKTYRWGGTAYVEISNPDLTEYAKRAELFPAWAKNTAYTTTSLVIHENAIYKCTTAHTSGAEWDSTKWAVASGAEVLAMLRDYAAQSNKPSINGVPLLGNKTAAQLGLATKADATLTERFSAWAVEFFPEAPAGWDQPVYVGDGIWRLQATIFTLIANGASDAISLDFVDEYGGGDTAHATRTALSGYQLGSQSDKPLASEAEAEALRNGKLDKSGGTMTGGLTVPNLTVGSRASGSTIGTNSTAEGYNTTASGVDSHAEGYNTTASGGDSHAEGYNTTTQNNSEHAQGRYNASHKASTTFGGAGNTLSSIGFGTAGSTRRNAVETMQNGKTFIYGLGGYDGTNPTSATDLTAAVNAKANRASPATAGNLAALDAQGNPTDAGWTAGDLARYSLVAKTIDNGAVSLDDRASNSVTVSATLSPNTLTINFPTATTGKLRDFAMRLNIAAGVTAPEIAWPQGVTLENDGGEVPEIADGGTGGSSTILYFSESENNGTTAKFTVKGETLTAIAQA